CLRDQDDIASLIAPYMSAQSYPPDQGLPRPHRPKRAAVRCQLFRQKIARHLAYARRRARNKASGILSCHSVSSPQTSSPKRAKQTKAPSEKKSASMWKVCEDHVAPTSPSEAGATCGRGRSGGRSRRNSFAA